MSRGRAGASTTPVALHGHEGAVWAIAFSSDGRLVSGGADASARVWDLAAPVALAPYISPARPAMAGGDGVVVHQRAAQALWAIDRACRAAGRNLSLAEWTRYMGAEAYHKTCPDLDIPPDLAQEQEQPGAVVPRSPYSIPK